MAERKRGLRMQAQSFSEGVDPAEADAVRSRLLALPEISSARSVSAYHARPGEIPIDGVVCALWDRGVHVALPRVQESDLRLHELLAHTRLVPSRLGVQEPEPGTPEIDPGAIDVFLVPGLLFDREGRRLGRGSGHFDRLLARAREGAIRVGVCHAERVREALPEDPWDIRMDLVVTTAELIEVSRESSR